MDRSRTARRSMAGKEAPYHLSIILSRTSSEPKKVVKGGYCVQEAASLLACRMKHK